MANYWMRAYDTVLVETVHWLSTGQPDFVGTGSGHTPGNLADFVVIRVEATAGGGAAGSWTEWAFPPVPVELYEFPGVALGSEALCPDLTRTGMSSP